MLFGDWQGFPVLSLRAAKPGRPYIIGHRGASGEAPENTMSAFALALSQGADLIELDVQMTADGVLVVIHDFAVDRTTNGQGLVKDLTLQDLRGMNAGARFPGNPQQEQ